MKTLILLFICTSTLLANAQSQRIKKTLTSKALINDSLYGHGKLFDKGSVMVGSTLGLEFGFVTGGAPNNHFVLQLGPSVNYFPIKRFMLGINTMQYASWTTFLPPRHYWDIGIQSKYFFLNHRSITIYPFVSYMFGNFDGYVNYEQNYKRTQIYHKIRAGAGINFRVKKEFTINIDVGWWQFLNKPKNLGKSGILYYQVGFNYVFKTER